MTRKNAMPLIVMMLLSNLLIRVPAQAGGIDLSTTQVFASEKIELAASSELVSVYLNVFRPNSDIWITIDFPEGVSPGAIFGNAKEFSASGHLVQLRLQTSDFLPSNILPILRIKDTNDRSIFELYLAPKDLPLFTFEGDKNVMSKYNYLLTPTVINGSFTLAIQGGKVRYFEKFHNPVIAFKDLTDSTPLRFASGTAKFAYLEKIELSRTVYVPGIWSFLDNNFQKVGNIGKIKVFGQSVYPDGHGVTTSPVGTPVVMSYVSRKVDSSWMTEPYKAPILDCVFSQLSNGKAIKSFSVWDWLDSNRSISGEILRRGERLVDFSREEKPIDFCHSNSIIYSKSLRSYIVSLRNLDLIMLIDTSLKNATALLYSPGARQHFARVVSSTKITALGNYTNGANSTLQTWTKFGEIWALSEINLPFKIAYCGNAEYLSENLAWIAGGCQNFETEGTAGILYGIVENSATEIGRLKLINSSGSYRIELYRG